MCLPFSRFICCKNSPPSYVTNERQSSQSTQTMSNHSVISSVRTVKHLPINDDHNLNNDFKKKVREIQHRYLSANDQRMIKTYLISLYQPVPAEIRPCTPRKRGYTCLQAFYNRAVTRIIPKELNDQYSTVLVNVLSDQQCFDYFQIQRHPKNKTVDFDQVYHWLKTENTFIHCYPKWISEHRPYRVYICAKTRFSGVLLDKMLTHNPMYGTKIHKARNCSRNRSMS